MTAARAAPQLVSVVVPARNAAPHLPAQLDALASQDYEGEWELVLADDGSEDRTAAVAEGWLGAGRRGRVVTAGPRHSPGRARNVGAAAAEGDFLAFCDADDVAAPEWLSGLAGAARRFDLVAGGIDIELLNDPLPRSWHRLSPRERALHGFGFLPFCSGSNTGVWSEVFEHVGGFDPGIRHGEDIEFSWRVQFAGHSLGLAESAVMHQRLRSSVLEMARQHVGYGTAGPMLLRRFGAAGMARRNRLAALRTLGWLAATAPGVAVSPRHRGRWALELGLAVGTLGGTVRHRRSFV